MFLHRVGAVLRWLLRRTGAEQDLEDELRGFVEMASADRVQGGERPADARRQALLELGGVEQVKERVRSGRHGGALDEFGRDLRYGLRQLRRDPAFTLTVVATLALGIGVNTAIFNLWHGVLHAPLPASSDPRRW